MAKLLLNLRHVPDDEAQEVRDLLDENGIGYYETPPNWWGISMGAIWLEDADQAERAKALMDAYQADRAQRVRRDYEQRKRAGEAETVWLRLWRHPVQVTVYVAICVVVLYFSIKPFMAFGQ